jgi:hypothetical protein
LDRQCGVEEHGVACTKSLACKQHQIALRRQVHGRSRPYDELVRLSKESSERRANIASRARTPPTEVAIVPPIGQAMGQIGQIGQVQGILKPYQSEPMDQESYIKFAQKSKPKRNLSRYVKRIVAAKSFS